jgi:CBS domain-containing protein
MARSVHEIMNPELFVLDREDAPADALGYLGALGILAAPVLDGAGRPIGFVSVRDLISDARAGRVGDRMTKPVLTVSPDVEIAEAGRLMGERGVHHLVVVDEAGVAIGIVSSLDVVRGLLGMPAPHPEAFPHRDGATGATWTDDLPLDLDAAARIPEGPGLLVLVRGVAGHADAKVWAEAPSDVRSRLAEILSFGDWEPAPLKRLLAHPGELRVRATAIADAHARGRALRKLARELTPLSRPA